MSFVSTLFFSHIHDKPRCKLPRLTKHPDHCTPGPPGLGSSTSSNVLVHSMEYDSSARLLPFQNIVFVSMFDLVMTHWSAPMQLIPIY